MSSLTHRKTLAALIALTIPLAACGSSSPNSGSGGGGTTADPATTQKNHETALKFASCMRSHGVPNFPDPGSNGGGGMLVQSTNGYTKVNGVSVNGPAFQSAMQACHSYLPNGGHPRTLSAARRNQMLAFSRCMRAHGLPNFPDPTFHGSHAGGIQFQSGSGIDPNSPAFKHAQAACGAPFGKVATP
jgi:hypothetical protein